MSLCGEPDRPEVQKNIDDLDNNLLTITGEFDKRSRSLEEALERSMYFQEELMVNILYVENSAVFLYKNEKIDDLGNDLLIITWESDKRSRLLEEALERSVYLY